MHFTSAALLTTSLVGALAAPIEQVSSVKIRGVKPEQATCKGYNNALWNIDQSVFKITVGRPYLDGSRCDSIKDKISANMDIDTLKCSGTDKEANTKLTLVSDMHEKNLANVNKALAAAYPEITFSCPTSLNYG